MQSDIQQIHSKTTSEVHSAWDKRPRSAHAETSAKVPTIKDLLDIYNSTALATFEKAKTNYTESLAGLADLQKRVDSYLGEYNNRVSRHADAIAPLIDSASMAHNIAIFIDGYSNAAEEHVHKGEFNSEHMREYLVRGLEHMRIKGSQGDLESLAYREFSLLVDGQAKQIIEGIPDQILEITFKNSLKQTAPDVKAELIKLERAYASSLTELAASPLCTAQSDDFKARALTANNAAKAFTVVTLYGLPVNEKFWQQHIGIARDLVLKPVALPEAKALSFSEIPLRVQKELLQRHAKFRVQALPRLPAADNKLAYAVIHKADPNEQALKLRAELAYEVDKLEPLNFKAESNELNDPEQLNLALGEIAEQIFNSTLKNIIANTVNSNPSAFSFEKVDQILEAIKICEEKDVLTLLLLAPEVLTEQTSDIQAKIIKGSDIISSQLPHSDPFNAAKFLEDPKLLPALASLASVNSLYVSQVAAGIEYCARNSQTLEIKQEEVLELEKPAARQKGGDPAAVKLARAKIGTEHASDREVLARLETLRRVLGTSFEEPDLGTFIYMIRTKIVAGGATFEAVVLQAESDNEGAWRTRPRSYLKA